MGVAAPAVAAGPGERPLIERLRCPKATTPFADRHVRIVETSAVQKAATVMEIALRTALGPMIVAQQGFGVRRRSATFSNRPGGLAAVRSKHSFGLTCRS